MIYATMTLAGVVAALGVWPLRPLRPKHALELGLLWIGAMITIDWLTGTEF